MKTCSILTLVCMSLLVGCSSLDKPRPAASPEPSTTPDARASSSGFDEFSRRDSSNDFSKSSFVVSDFMNVVVRVPDFIPGSTRFSSALPRTRYGEILMEALRQEGFAIVLGDSQDVPALRYSIALPSENTPYIHTFFLRLGGLELKRSYEILGERIAPVSAMLMAGINPGSLRPLNDSQVTRNTPTVAASATRSNTDVSVFATTPASPPLLLESDKAPTEADLGVERINELVNADEAWNPLDVNLYDTGESVYEPMFADATRDYENVASQVLVFPNDSLVLGDENKNYLFELAEQVIPGEDIIHLVGCSHGKSQLSDGNEKLAKGRAIRVKEELLLAGVDESAILHEVCWADVHFDEKFPRRGVVVMHLRPRG